MLYIYSVVFYTLDLVQTKDMVDNLRNLKTMAVYIYSYII